MMKCITYSIKQISAILGVSYTKAYNLVTSGVIPCVKLGGQYFIPCDVFESWFSSQIKGGEAS